MGGTVVSLSQASHISDGASDNSRVDLIVCHIACVGRQVQQCDHSGQALVSSQPQGHNHGVRAHL